MQYSQWIGTKVASLNCTVNVLNWISSPKVFQKLSSASGGNKKEEFDRTQGAVDTVYRIFSLSTLQTICGRSAPI